MRELLDFLIQHSKWLLFLAYMGISLALLFSGNPYQHHVYLTSANAVASGVYTLSSNVTSYFHLRDINHDLNSRNAELQSTVIALRQQLQDISDKKAQDSVIDTPTAQFRFVVAHVINNSISHPFNYITINKGSADGIAPEMGVIDQSGVVGSVNVVSEHSARVISVLNPNFHVSCKIKGSDYFGSLSWDGKNPYEAMLEDLPQHAKVQPGDTIMTTGFSAVFPPDLTVGYVLGQGKGSKLSLSNLHVRLATDFTTLSTVQVVVNTQYKELKQLEESDDIGSSATK